MDYIFHYSSSIGHLTLTSDGVYLTGLRFDKQKYGAGTPNSPHQKAVPPMFKQVVHWLDIYFSGEVPNFIPPIKINTTPFRKQVCEIMLTIPHGQTITYGEIAAKIAKKNGLKKMSAQAVGGAVGHNPIALIIPCHRVIGSDGSLTGYGGGISQKSQLLQMEKNPGNSTRPTQK